MKIGAKGYFLLLPFIAPPSPSVGKQSPRTDVIVTENTTPYQPRTGYRWADEAVPRMLRLSVDGAGWNNAVDGNDGRTGIAAYKTIVHQNGNGDAGAYYGFCEIGGRGRVAATHWLAMPACVVLNGDLGTTLDHSYLNEQEFNLSDNGHDVAAIGVVQNFHRNNARAAWGEVWMGSRLQSDGAEPIDVGLSVSGWARIGVDTTTAAVSKAWNNGSVVALNMAAGQSVIFNSVAEPMNGIRFYGQRVGQAIDRYDPKRQMLSRCNAGSCLSVGDRSFVADGTIAGDVLEFSLRNQATDGLARITVNGGGNQLALVSGNGHSLFSSKSEAFAVEVGGKSVFSTKGKGGVSLGGSDVYVAVEGALRMAVPRYIRMRNASVTDDDYSLIFVSSEPVILFLPDANQQAGRILKLKNSGSGLVESSKVDVVALDGINPSRQLLSAGKGHWVELQSDGAHWVVMAGN